MKQLLLGMEGESLNKGMRESIANMLSTSTNRPRNDNLNISLQQTLYEHTCSEIPSEDADVRGR